MNWINHFEPHILERGWEYYRSGAVEHLVKVDNKVEAVVRGSEYYKVKIVYQRCELLAEEHMLMELFEQIEQTKDNIPLLDKYGFLLGHIYAEQILTTYMQYVEEIAADARNRSQYNLLISYLKRMQQYPDGTRLVRMLCLKWIEQYPTRRVMTEELRELLRS